MKLKLGTVVLASTGAIVPTGSITDLYWELTGEVVCRAAGTAGGVMPEARFLFQKDASTREGILWGGVNTGTVVVNTTAAQAVDMTAQWGTGITGNSISAATVAIEALN